MRTEQPTECLYHISYGGLGCACKTSLSPPVIITDCAMAVVLVWSLLAVWCQSFCDVSHYVCSLYF